MTLSELVRRRTVPRTAYLFDGTEGRRSLPDLFEGHRRLAVFHTMPDHCLPGDDEAPLELVSGLAQGDMRLVLASRAPYAKLAQYRRHLGWDLPCYSAAGTFTDDFAATWRVADTPPAPLGADVPGLSFFSLERNTVEHTGSLAVPGLDFLVRTWGLPRRAAVRG
jgi:predicted dithiol-disulfide oxidoreductase (DUF899 family)